MGVCLCAHLPIYDDPLLTFQCRTSFSSCGLFFCLEAEGSFRENRISALHFDDTVFVTSGHLYSISAICNGILEVPLLRNGLIPYVGFGLGHQWVLLHFTIDPVATQKGFYIFDSCLINNYGLAYQGIIGMIFMKRQKFQLGSEYRYLNQFRTEPGNHTLDVKLRYLF